MNTQSARLPLTFETEEEQESFAPEYHTLCEQLKDTMQQYTATEKEYASLRKAFGDLLRANREQAQELNRTKEALTLMGTRLYTTTKQVTKFKLLLFALLFS